jgi:glycerol dehydrogenase
MDRQRNRCTPIAGIPRRANLVKFVLIAPRKYIQGRGVLAELGTYLKMLGRRPLVLWDECVRGLVGATVRASLADAGMEPVEAMFQGEATPAERRRVREIAERHHADISVGVGGGKILDVAKAVAVDLGLKMVTCPTIASNDSPTSAASVWYDEQGNFTGFDCWPFNPDLVLVDSQVIATGPVRAFVAGMGDALSTWVETEAAYKTRALNLAGGVPTMAAVTLARLCFDTLMEHGRDAKRDLEQRALTPAVEKVIEANVLLSGLGFESGGLATAHMVGNLLSNVPQCKRFMHGEKVGFGIVTQLCLDDELGTQQRNAIVDFQIDVGLPVTLADVNLDGATRAELEALGKACAGEGSLCHNHPFPVTAEAVVDAMIAADALGRQRKKLAGVK